MDLDDEEGDVKKKRKQKIDQEPKMFSNHKLINFYESELEED